MKKRLLATFLALVMLIGLLPVMALAADPQTAIYIGASGDDENSGSSPESPVATLGRVSDIIGDSADSSFIIYVMSDITTTTSLRTWNKHVTLTSYDPDSAGVIYTISRGDGMAAGSDLARIRYNPAMIESNGSGANNASLTLYNITLDDAGNHEGEYYIQADSEGDGSTVFGDMDINNTSIAQDAIIATYNGVSTITLGEGTTLKNFGGMSAVRLSDGKLIMESGSLICDEDTVITDRISGEAGSFGPAGAIWMQGGTITMEEGSEISDVLGRAIYEDGGKAVIGGTISGIASDSHMWNGTSGFAIHVRSGASAELTSTGKIDGENIKTSGTAVFVIGLYNESEADDEENEMVFSSLEMETGSEICNINNANAVALGAYSKTNFNGEIYGLTSANAFNVQSIGDYPEGIPDGTELTSLVIGENGLIHDNEVWWGAIYAHGKGINIHLYGKIVDNVSGQNVGGITLSNNWSGQTLTMYDGAEISRNVVKDASGNAEYGAGAVSVRCGTFIMKGGTIEDNLVCDGGKGTHSYGGAVYVLRGGKFIMEGGEIKNNATAGIGGAIALSAHDYNNLTPYVQLNGGTISGNLMGVTVTETDGVYSYTGGESNNFAILSVDGAQNGRSDRYFMVGPDVEIDNPDIYMQNHDFTIIDPARGIKFGIVDTANESELITASDARGWDGNLLAALWMQSGNAQELAFTGVDDNAYYNADLPVYALVMGTGEDGNVPAGGSAAAYAVTKNPDGTMTAAIPSTGANGSSVALVQPTEDYGTLTMTASPESIASGDFTDGKAAISYTASYLLSDNLKNQITVDQEFTLTISLDSLLDYTADSMMVNGQPAAAVDNGDGTISVTFTADSSTDEVAVSFSAALDAADFSAGGQLLTSGEISAELPVPDSTVSVRVPSNAAIVEMEPYAITASAGTGGSISPSGTVLADQGESLTFTITADSGYEISNVLVDGASVGAVSTYTFKNVTSDHTIAASFRSTSSGGGTVRHTITASAGDGGSIDPDGSVRVRRGSDQAFTITPDEGYKISDVLVDGESVGAVRSYTFENVRANHTIEAVFEETGKVADPDDTGVSDWLNTDDHTAYLNGYPDGTFRPDRNMTRAEAAQLFYNLLLDKDVAATVTFDDVDSSAWYAGAVDTLASLGIINGVGDGKFEPERSITRAEFTAIAMRFADLETGGENIFSDVDEADWFYDVVVGSIQYGWINGYPDGTFRPYDDITRAEVTAIVNRMLGRSADTEYVDGHEDSLRQFSDLDSAHWAYYDIAEAANGHTYSKSGSTESWTELD